MPARRIKGWWYAGFYFEGVRYRKRSPENSRVGAQAYELLLRQRLARGEDINRKPIAAEKPKTFGEFATEWFATYVTANNKPSEQRNKQLALRKYLVPWFGKTALTQINELDVERFKAALRRSNLCNKSINNYLAILRKALACARSWKLISDAPLISQLKYQVKPVNVLTDEECCRLLQDDAEPDWHAMILLALRSGLRLGELFGLRWEDIDRENRVITIERSIVRGEVSTPKSGRSRYLPLDASFEAALLHLSGRQTGLVFQRADGGPLSYRIAARALDRACRRSGIRHVGWHALRHTVGTQLHKERVPMRDIQTILGHSTMAMTERYTHVRVDDLRAGIATLGTRQDRFLEELGQRVGSSACDVHAEAPTHS